MSLFNLKALKWHIKPAPIPTDHLAALDAWADMMRSGRVYALKETALHGPFAAKIIEGDLAGQCQSRSWPAWRQDPRSTGLG
jgi:hypothetical protein